MTAPEFKSIRAALHLTQVQLADALGMSRPSIARIEAGRQVINKRTEKALGMLLDARPIPRAAKT